MTAEIQVTFDAHDPRRLGLFWREVLDYAVDPPPGGEIGDPVETADAWLAFLTKVGVPEELHNSAFGIVDPAGTGPRVFFQQVPEDKVGQEPRAPRRAGRARPARAMRGWPPWRRSASESSRWAPYAASGSSPTAA